MAEQQTMHDDEKALLRALVSGPAVGVPQHADEGVRETFTERRMAQREAYGQYIAAGPIYVPGTGTLAFNKDQQVPIEHVEKWMLVEADMVHRVASAELARAGARFPAKDGGQLPGAEDTTEPVPPQPTATPPAPAGEEAAKADEGGTTEKTTTRRSSSSKASAADKTDDK